MDGLGEKQAKTTDPALLQACPIQPGLAAPEEDGPRPWTELLTCKTSQQNRSLHRNRIIFAKQIPQQLIPGSSTESSFSQREGMQQTWLLFQKYFETISNKSFTGDFTAENRARGVGGWELALQSSRKNSLQENRGHSRERQEAGWKQSPPLSQHRGQSGSAQYPPVQCQVHMPQVRTVPEVSGSTRPQHCSLPCPVDKPPAPQSLCGPEAGQGRSRSCLGTAGLCILAGLAIAQSIPCTVQPCQQHCWGCAL